MKFLGKGKAYHYKDKVIGVCPTLNEKATMSNRKNESTEKGKRKYGQVEP